MSGSYQWRGYPWPHSIEGRGGSPGVEAYPFQGLDLNTEPYEWPWLKIAKRSATITRENMKAWGVSGIKFSNSGSWKHENQFTPLGTSVARLVRESPDSPGTS